MRYFPKTFLVLVAVLGPGLAAPAQVIPAAHVPPLAFVALQQLYPLARDVKWKRTQGWYQASYTQSQTHRLVRFDRDGDVRATGFDVAPAALPRLVRQALSENYSDRKICQAAAITNVHTKGLTYEMATCESHISTTIVLTPTGVRVPRIRVKREPAQTQDI
jgi:hypothetical protein